MLLKVFKSNIENSSYRGTIAYSDRATLPAYFQRDYVPSYDFVDVMITGMLVNDEGYPKCFFVREIQEEDEEFRVSFEGFIDHNNSVYSVAKFANSNHTFTINPGKFYRDIKRRHTSLPKAEWEPMQGCVGWVQKTNRFNLIGIDCTSVLSIKE